MVRFVDTGGLTICAQIKAVYWVAGSGSGRPLYGVDYELWTLCTPHAVVAGSQVRGSMKGLVVQDEDAYTTYLHHSSLRLDQIIVQTAMHHSTVPAPKSTQDVIVPVRQQRESGFLMMTCPYRFIIPRRRCCGKMGGLPAGSGSRIPA
ncbi:hypothetical protein Landi51_02233 [Colletotrichum acutatum]